MKSIFNPLADEIQGTLDSLRRDSSRVESIAQAEEAMRANEDRKKAKAKHAGNAVSRYSKVLVVSVD